MVGAFILGSTKNLTDYLYWAALGCQDLNLHKVLDEPPNLHYLVRLFNAFGPKIVFLELHPLETALKLARDIRAVSPETSCIGFAESVRSEELKQAARTGIGEVLQTPFSDHAVAEAIARALDSTQPGEQNETVTFQPARGGSGATRVAWNVAWSLANHWQRKVLLMEADLHSGPLSVLLDLPADKTVVDALSKSDGLAEPQWDSFVSRVQGVDLLPAPKVRRSVDASAWDCQRLLGFVQPLYDCVVVDLPEVLPELLEPFVKRASKHYVVCTPDTVSVFMARRRLAELEEAGVDPANLEVVLNRREQDEMPVGEIENFLSRPVRTVLSSQVSRLARPAKVPGLAAESTPLGREFRSFAQLIAKAEQPIAPESAASEADPVLEGKGLSKWLAWSFGKIQQ